MAETNLIKILTDFILSILNVILGTPVRGQSYGTDLAGFLDVALMGIVILIILALDLALFIIWLERKLMARMMTRRGPTHQGPYGLFQNLADTLKLISKEIINPKMADKFGFHFAVVIAVVTAAMSVFVLPFSETFLVTAPNAGVLLIFALFSLYPIGVLVAGWSSNNKYSLLGGFRSAAQLISYEVPLMLSLIGVLILANWNLPASQRTFSFLVIGQYQIDFWLFLLLPVGFAVAFTAMLGETERVPFDIPEAESELVMGWRTEYPASPFLLIMAVEYFHMFVNSGIVVIMFFGAWYMPFGLGDVIDPAIWFLIKLHIFVIIMIWIRAALPRVRIDQFLMLGWTRLIPMSVLNLFWAIGLGFLLYDSNLGITEPMVILFNIVFIGGLFLLVGLFSKRKSTVNLVDPSPGGN
jgi:NADH-quinone oxidoreductase subunit H